MTDYSLKPIPTTLHPALLPKAPPLANGSSLASLIPIKTPPTALLPNSGPLNNIREISTQPQSRDKKEGSFLTGPVARMLTSSIVHIPNSTYIKAFSEGTQATVQDMTPRGMQANASRILIKWSIMEKVVEDYKALFANYLPKNATDNDKERLNALATWSAAISVSVLLSPIERIRSIQATHPKAISMKEATQSMINKGGVTSLFRGWQMTSFDVGLLALTPAADFGAGMAVSALAAPARSLSYALRFKQQVTGVTLQEAATSTMKEIALKPTVFLTNGVGHAILHGPIYSTLIYLSLLSMQTLEEEVKQQYQNVSKDST